VVKSLTAKEILKIIEKMWASTDDIKKLGCVGNNKALKIKNEIKTRMQEEGYAIPRNLVDMKLVTEYFNIDEQRVKFLASKGGVCNE